MLGQDKSEAKKANNTKSSIQSIIKKRLYEVCEETLRKEFPQHFYNLDDTQVVKKSTKKDVEDEVYTISGKSLCFPIFSSFNFFYPRRMFKARR